MSTCLYKDIFLPVADIQTDKQTKYREKSTVIQLSCDFQFRRSLIRVYYHSGEAIMGTLKGHVEDKAHNQY